MTERIYVVKGEYGMGGAAVATLSESEVRGKSAGELLSVIAARPQAEEVARRTAWTLKEVLNAGRVLDVEVTRGKCTENVQRRPVELGDVVVADIGTEPSEEEQSLTLHVSEDYKGGTGRWLAAKHS